MSDKPREKQTRNERIESLDATPNDRLRGLVEQWREDATTYQPLMTTDERATLKDCAGELEALIDE